jgi:hypothetical protein
MGGGMSGIQTYRLRAESDEALWTMLAGASMGKGRAYAFAGPDGERFFDEARVRLPWREVSPFTREETNPDTGEIMSIEALTPSGFRLCEVSLVGEDDPDLAALAAG